MAFPTFRMRVLILAAYMFAAILPMLAVGEGGQQSQAEHARMMSMAGHLANMPATGGPNDMTQQMICQQHCLFAAAAFPAADRVAETAPRSTDGDADIVMLPASLTIPPPGPPPKFAVI